jgi:hypothetical protein
MNNFVNQIFERVAYWSFKRILLGYAKVFSTGLFALEAHQDRFEQQAKAVAADHWKHLNELNQRLLKLESKESV